MFTTHTPVPAGNDRFAPKLAMKYLAPYADALNVSDNDLLGLGREDEHDRKEEFCMTVLALKLAEHCNGVAALHGNTSRHMWMKVYRALDANHVPIGHITNGIHPQTWLAQEMTPLYDKYLRPDFVTPAPDKDPWERVEKIPDAELWRYRNLMRAKLIHFVRQRLLDAIARGHGPIADYQRAYETFDADTLTIGFARRFATYKRAPLVFHDAKRLAKILAKDGRPVQIVFAGKAHPADMGGQAFAAEIYRHAKEAAFSGRIAIIEDYDMAVGRALTSGADVWLNNPLRPQEASGTSGMKPPLHGGLNCSILDGWWPEAYDAGDRRHTPNGWAIGGKEFTDQKKQDAFDAASIYTLLEKQIVPAFYDRNRSGLPKRWVAMMKSCMTTVCSQFSTTRMVAEYWTKYYAKAAKARPR
ncbi:MAG: alpha-glucan family phosphorylase [Chitinophagaceae bacterium]